MTLRPYQQEASDAIMAEIKRSLEPCLIEAATGAGKSHIIADVGQRIFSASGKRVLCLAPSAELVKQNYAKFVASGNSASIYSASAGRKCLRHPVVFGTPGTVKNRISRFAQDMAAIVIDECHGITPTVQKIVDALRQTNPRIRVIGCTATPYRMNEGYIFNYWPDGSPVADWQGGGNGYFGRCVFRIRARQLLDMGYLTPVEIGAINSGHYDTSSLALNSMGNFTADSVDQAYHGHGRLTASIVADIVSQSSGRNGVLVFAATVQHAQEVLASLPPGLSKMITGTTPKAERAAILRLFDRQEIKYLVNVSVLTTGFDAPHIDVVALLRRTESVGLLQQMVGRGLRLYDGKSNCLLLDYAENIKSHCPDGDIFSPEVKASKRGGVAETLDAVCPDCGTTNEFKVRENEAGYMIDEAGYFTDLDGERIETDYGSLPAHYGRRCFGAALVAGAYERCFYRWTFKECPHCGAENDIAARYCHDCRGEIVDPNEKLAKDFKAFKRDPTQLQCDKVVSFEAKESVSQRGKNVIRCDVVTEYRRFSYWLTKGAAHPQALRDLELYQSLGGEQPTSITYRKDAESGFYRVYNYNRPVDEVKQH